MSAGPDPQHFVPEIAGTPFGGGIYAGRFILGTKPYALTVSPADEGELKRTAWGRRKGVAGADSCIDGHANTQAMAESGNKLAQWARALRIGEHDDWYIPSRLELLIAFGELGVKGAFATAWYWTSTQAASYDDYAWGQGFDYGGQFYYRKTSKLRARAVRRLAI